MDVSVISTKTDKNIEFLAVFLSLQMFSGDLQNSIVDTQTSHGKFICKLIDF